MGATPDRSPGREVESESRLRLTELDRDWALRRLELFTSLDGSVQQAMGTVLEVTTRVLQTADELRREMEGQASDLVAQLRSEREALLGEIEAHRRERDALAGEMAELRRGVDEEIGRVRREAEEGATRQRQQAEAEAARRRREADQESAARQRQAEGEIAAARARAEAEIAVLRQQAEAEIAVLQQRAEAEREAVLAEAQARRLALVGEIRELEEQLGAVASQLQAMVNRRGPGAGLEALPEPPGNPGAPSTGPVSRKAAARLVDGAASRPEATPGGAPGASVAVSPADTPGPNGPASMPEARAAGSRGATAVATRSTAARVTVRRITAFSSALELQRSIQNSQGVRDVQALQFEDGTLVLAVQHDADLDLADAIARLPIQTELLARSSGDLELTVAPR
ncbi:MAG TPA: hypothetical protein VGM69_24225 [Chloroflexota bacterium]|jgi:uncharacterized protein YhaN